MATYSDSNVSEMIFNVLDSATYSSLSNNNQLNNNQLYFITDDETYVPKTEGVTAVSWDSTNKKIRRTINGTAADVVQFIAGSNISLSAEAGKLTIASSYTNTATAADNILDGSNSGTQITYAPYSTQQTKLSFDTSTTNPTRTDRLNLNGYLYATKLYSGGNEVLTSHQSVTNNNVSVGWNTETTIATIGGTAIKIKIPANPNTDTDISTLTLASDTGTSGVVALAHGGKYKLTAGTKSVIFTLPSDNNTNYYHTTGSWNGLTYTATANGGAGALAFTIPTGTTSTTVALGNHTHATSIATSTGTNQITLASGGKYAITAGGTSYIFTMPSDNNTDTLVKQTAKSDNVNYKILMTTSASPTSGNAAEAAYDTDITINPSTNTITATNFAGNASTATKLATARTINGTSFDGSANITTANWGTSRTITIGSTGKSVNGSGNVSWSHSEIGATVSNSWTAGTTAGPTITTTVNGVSGTAVAIPTATASASGIVTTDTQSFGGTKTFESTAASTSTSTGGVIVKGGIGVAGQVTATRVGINGSNTSYGLYVNGTSLLTGILTQNNTTDSAHSADTGASMVVKGGISVAKKVSAKEIRIDNSQQSKGVHLQYDETLEVLNFVFA